MKIAVTNYGQTITIEKDREDLTIDEWLDIFETLMLGITFSREIINEGIIEKAEEIKNG